MKVVNKTHDVDQPLLSSERQSSQGFRRPSDSVAGNIFVR